ncbi:MAG: hypothetical protein J5585_06920 [Clostridia bacterium]|nr:hypothetical protein [Clostridia bacterium]
MTREHFGHKAHTTRKLSADEYVDTRNGEIKQFNHHNNRGADIRSVKRSLGHARDLINTNITDTRRCRFLTLTYAENLTGTERLYLDFKHFVERCRRRYGYFEYISIPEPQGRESWHIHCFFIFKDIAPFMENSIVASFWKDGFVYITKLDGVDNVGAYLTSHLSDIELTDDTEDKYDGQIKTVYYEENGEKKSKRFIKGARLHLYPPGFNIFRCSRGIKKPTVEEMSYHDAKEKKLPG